MLKQQIKVSVYVKQWIKVSVYVKTTSKSDCIR